MVWSWSLHFTLSLACATAIWFCLIGRRSMQISLLFLASAKIKGAFQLRAIKEWKIIQCLDWYWNLQLHKLKPHVVFGGATNTFPHLESTMCCQKPWDLLCTRPGHTLQANAQSVHWTGLCTVNSLTALTNLLNRGIWEENPCFIGINVNHVVNSSPNYQ